MILRMPIDIKSLYLNIKNDNEKGHTATVATPLKQYGTWHKELANILKIPEKISKRTREGLIDKILSKSRADAKINHIYVFDKIKVNGIPISPEASFCIYVREETNRNNVHFERQKVHYPTSFKYDDLDTHIDNKIVMKTISKALCDYAFIIEAFEYDTATDYLNFDAIVVGQNNIPYSKVFVNKRGVGSKFTKIFNEEADTYDSEIISMREHLGYDKIGPENYLDEIETNRDIAFAQVMKYLESRNTDSIRNIRNLYPYSLYDFEYKQGQEKKYIITRYTSGNVDYFNLPMHKIAFCNDFAKDTNVFLVTNVRANRPKLKIFDATEIFHMKKTITSMCFMNTGDCK